MDRIALRQQLPDLAEGEYKKFSQALVPTNKNVMLGVKLPLLRKLAAEIARGDWRAFLDSYEEVAGEECLFEELMIRGMVINRAQMELDERLERVKEFVPGIDNWSVCDSFCTGAKWVSRVKAPVWEFLQPYLSSRQAFEIRYGVIMLLAHFLDAEYISGVLAALDAIACVRRGHDAPEPEHLYYVEMAVAWCLATAAAKCNRETLAYLQHSSLSGSVLKKTAQKMRDSYRISPEDKIFITELIRQKSIN